MLQHKVFVQGRPFNGMTRDIFLGRPEYRIVESISQSDIVVWTGGEDINPALYKEKKLAGTYFNPTRDKSDLEAVEEAYANGKFLVGICRGAQLLNVIPNGGSLWQNVDNHAGGGCHPVFDIHTKKWEMTNSVHHQMMIPGPNAELIAYAEVATAKQKQGEEWFKVESFQQDVEVLWYEHSKSLLVQFHPEFGHPHTTKYFFNLMDRFILNRKECYEAA